MVRIVAATSGRAVLARAVPLFGAIGIGAAIVFAANGLRAAVAVRAMHESLGVRAAIWIVWIALATPATSAAFDAPGTRTLRSIARKSAALVACVVALVALVQAPMVALFARGDRAPAAVAVALLGTAACAAASVAWRSRRALAILAGTCAVVAIDRALPPLVAIAPAALLAWHAVREAWRSALEERPSTRIVRRAPPAIALAMAYVARMIRDARGRLQSSALVTSLGGGVLALSLRNDPDARPVQRALVVLALPISTACALLAAPAIETEARITPTLRATRTKPLTVALAMILAIAAPSTAFAGTASAVAAVASSAPQTVTIATMAWAAIIASSIALWARRASRARRSSTFLVGTIVIASAFTAAAASC